MVVARSDAEMPVVTPLRASIRDREGSPVDRSVVGDLGSQMQFVAAFFSEWQADQPARVGCHEVDNLWCDLLSSANEIAFVLAIFVVDDDDHSAIAYLCGGFFDRCKWHFVIHIPIRNQWGESSKDCGSLTESGKRGYVTRKPPLFRPSEPGAMA